MTTLPSTLTVQGVSVPAFLYGTAWKQERTEALVGEALAAGFRGIDTANQRRHYFEEGVGAALRVAFERGEVSRDEVFLQTKLTHAAGHDHRMPYDPAAAYPLRVRQSFASSLEHLGVETIDSYVLHGPSSANGLTTADVRVWKAMEALHRDGCVRLLGVSNVSSDQLYRLCQLTETPIAFVQNRCFARTGWDALVRRLAAREGILYQGFSLLTANQAEIAQPVVGEIAARHDKTRAQVVFRFARQLGMICLTGTTDRRHMDDDLAIDSFELSEEEMKAMAELGQLDR